MTNKEWLDYLAHNAPDELAAWFDAEHVETEERALDGDIEPQNADSRERLEAEIESYSAFDMMDTITLDMVIGWLDRQAAITAEETRDELKEFGEYYKLQYELASEDADRLTAEREKYRKLFGKALDYAADIHALTYELDEGLA